MPELLKKIKTASMRGFHRLPSPPPEPVVPSFRLLPRPVVEEPEIPQVGGPDERGHIVE